MSTETISADTRDYTTHGWMRLLDEGGVPLTLDESLMVHPIWEKTLLWSFSLGTAPGIPFATGDSPGIDPAGSTALSNVGSIGDAARTAPLSSTGYAWPTFVFAVGTYPGNPSNNASSAAYGNAALWKAARNYANSIDDPGTVGRSADSTGSASAGGSNYIQILMPGMKMRPIKLVMPLGMLVQLLIEIIPFLGHD